MFVDAIEGDALALDYTPVEYRVKWATLPWEADEAYKLRRAGFGSRLAVHAAVRSHAKIGATLIRLAVSSAHAQGCETFLAHVQAQNVPLFRVMHWDVLAEEMLLGRPHHL